MTGHLTPDEQIDSLEGTLAPGRATHLDGCEGCRGDVARLRETFESARAVDVPEPSPLFWPHQATRISEAVAAESIERPRLTWIYAAWMGSTAAVLAAGLLFVRTSSTPSMSVVDTRLRSVESRAAVPVASPSRSGDGFDERAWSVVEALGGQIDADAAVAAVTPATGAADRALEALDADEQSALVRVLRQELKGKVG